MDVGPELPPPASQRDPWAWGPISLGAAIACPLLLLLPFWLRDHGIVVAVSRLSFLILCPGAAILAIVAGRRSGQGPHDPLSGRWGFVLGILEAVMIGLLVLFAILAQDQLNESL